jgi:hypothetical protein
MLVLLGEWHVGMLPMRWPVRQPTALGISKR